MHYYYSKKGKIKKKTEHVGRAWGGSGWGGGGVVLPPALGVWGGLMERAHGQVEERLPIAIGVWVGNGEWRMMGWGKGRRRNEGLNPLYA